MKLWARSVKRRWERQSPIGECGMCHKLILNASGNITSIWDSQSSVACCYRSSLPGFFHYKRCSPKKAPCGQNLKTSGILPSSGPGTSAFWLPHQIEFSLGCSADYINKHPPQVNQLTKFPSTKDQSPIDNHMSTFGHVSRLLQPIILRKVAHRNIH